MKNYSNTERLLSIFKKFSVSRKEGLMVIFYPPYCFYVNLRSRNNYDDSDPLGCLLVSQAIVSHGTIKLDAYRDMLQQRKSVYTYRIITKNNHLFYGFPLGTCIYSVPFVWLANLAGGKTCQPLLIIILFMINGCKKFCPHLS